MGLKNMKVENLTESKKDIKNGKRNSKRKSV